MTDDDFTILINSYDENDFEVISSNDSEINDLIDHYENLPPNIPPTINLNSEDSEDFEDETFTERLYGLTEMFPNWFQTYLLNSFQYSKQFGRFFKDSIWFCSSSFIILLLPILIELEYSEINQFQTRQILIGPAAQIGIHSIFGSNR